jgi:hypothetical protein
MKLAALVLVAASLGCGSDNKICAGVATCYGVQAWRCESLSGCTATPVCMTDPTLGEDCAIAASQVTGKPGSSKGAAFGFAADGALRRLESNGDHQTSTSPGWHSDFPAGRSIRSVHTTNSTGGRHTTAHTTCP